MPRIVSLISSATEIVHALGQLQNQVGRSHECDFPPEVVALPVCTKPTIDIHSDSREIDRQVKDRVRTALSVYEVFDDVLERLQPTHIITQTQCEVCAVSLRDVERSMAACLDSHPQIVSLNPNSIADISDDIRRVARALGIERHGEEVVASLESHMSTIAAKAGQSLEHPRVACIEWIEPLMAAGNWTPELIAMAGGVNLFGEAAKHAPWMSWEDLVERDPDAIVVAPCGFEIARTRSEMHWLTARREWPALRAVRCGRVYLADGNRHFNRPGPRLAETLETLAEMLHPADFPARFAGEGWEKL